MASEPNSNDDLNAILAELRWYGKTIAGGGPMGGYAQAAQRAAEHWYVVTLPLLYKMNAVYGPKDWIGCIKCHGQGVKASKMCRTCDGSGMVAPALAAVASGKGGE